MKQPIFTCKKELLADVESRQWGSINLSVSKIDNGFIEFSHFNALNNLVEVIIQIKSLDEFLTLDITEDTTLEELLNTPLSLCLRTVVKGEETIYFDATDDI